MPAHLLNPVSGSIVLDMCAAPGMKATHIAAKLQNYGYVICIYVCAACIRVRACVCFHIESVISNCTSRIKLL